MAAILLLGALVVIAAWGMATLAMARAQGAPAARRVALLLFILGADVATSVVGVTPLLPARELSAMMTVHFMLDSAVPPLTLLFMAQALDTPVARILRRRPVEVALGALSLGGAGVAWVAVHRMPDLAFIPYLFGYIALGFLAAFLLAVHGWRGAEGTERRRAGMFALAFGVLDVTWAIAFGGVALRGPSVDLALQFAYGGGALVFALVLGYAILQHRLLGIDVKLRWTISKSTVAAVFVAVFFLASEGAQMFFGQGNEIVGLIAAGALVFALSPLQRVADRLAERAVPSSPGPGPGPGPGPTSPGKEQAYRSALRAALRDRVLTHEEEIGLAHLSDELGLTHKRAREIWHEVEREGTREGAAHP